METQEQSSYSDPQTTSVRPGLLTRTAALLALLAVLAVLAWGAFLQPSRNNPFGSVSLVTWLLTPEPDPAIQAMPLQPIDDLRLAPIDLCAAEAACAGFLRDAIAPNVFNSVDGVKQRATALARSPSSGQVLAVTSGGMLFSIARANKPVWRPIHLPTIRSRPISLDKQYDTITAADFSQDGSWIATGYVDGSTRLWDATTGRLVQTIKRASNERPIQDVAIAPAGDRLARRLSPNEIDIWDVTKADPRLLVAINTEATHHLQFSPDGRMLLTSSPQGVSTWDARTGAAISSYLYPTLAAIYSPDGSELAIATSQSEGSQQIIIAEVATGEIRTSIVPTPYGSTPSLSYSADGSRLLIAGAKGETQIINVSKGLLQSRDDKLPIRLARFSFDRPETLAILEQTYVVRDENGQAAAIGSIERRMFDRPLVIAASGNSLLISSTNGIQIQQYSGQPFASDVAISKTGKIWVVGGAGYVASSRDGREWASTQIFGAPVSISPLDDGSAVILTSDGALRILNDADLDLSDPTSDSTPQSTPQISKDPNGTDAPSGKVDLNGKDGTPQIPEPTINREESSASDKKQVQDRFVPQPENATATLSTKSTKIAEAVVPGTLMPNPAQKRVLTDRADRAQVEQRATNSGANLNPLGERRFTAISFASSKEGWAVADDGSIQYTNDTGTNWKTIYARPDIRLASIHVEPFKVGWAVGRRQDGKLTVLAADDALEPSSSGGWHELQSYLAPWCFLLGIPLLLSVGFWSIRAWRPAPEVPPPSIEEIANSDSPLKWSDPGARSLTPVVQGLSRFLRNINTKPPLTLAVTGRWGSGKSSLMALLMSDLQRYGGRAVWFNAWHHHEEEHLLAALFNAIRQQAAPKWWSWPGIVFRARLLWLRSKGLIVSLLYATCFLAIAILTARLALPAVHVDEMGRLVDLIAKLVGKEVAESWRGYLTIGLSGSAGLIILISLWFRGKLVALPANPAKLVAALTKRASLSDFTDKLAFRQIFGQQFGDACEALLSRTSPGLVILIDDLDRCSPEDVLKILEAVNYLVSAGQCTIILGMDRRQIEYCVGLGFERLVEGLPEDELIYSADESADKAGRQRAFARHYLEKLINIEVAVPTLDEASTSSMLVGSLSPSSDPAPTQPVWWVRPAKDLLRNGFQFARVALIAVFIGMLLTWAAEQFREQAAVVVQSSVRVPAKPEGKRTLEIPHSSGDGGPANLISRPRSSEVFEFQPIELISTSQIKELPVPRRWLWWAPTTLLLGFALLFGVAATVRQRQLTVRDSPSFAKALGAVTPLFVATGSTPRAIKRYQNRMRYLAARLRPPLQQPDAIDALLHWLGKKIGRYLVPPEWFLPPGFPAIKEPALILLGAIESIAPRLFDSPVDFYARLQNSIPPEYFGADQVLAWNKVFATYRANSLVLPEPTDIVRYSSFVLRSGPTLRPQSAEVIPIHRDSPNPR
jgi:WD40 repeat protein